MTNQTPITDEAIQALGRASEITLHADGEQGIIRLTRYGGGIWGSQTAEISCRAQIHRGVNDDPTLIPTYAKCSILCGHERDVFNSVVDQLKPDDVIEIIFLSNHVTPPDMIENGISLDTLVIRIHRKTGGKTPKASSKIFQISARVSDGNWQRMITNWEQTSDLKDNETEIENTEE